MSVTVPGLGKIQAVTGVSGETRVVVDWTKQMLSMSPAKTRELAAALETVAAEAEAIGAAARARPAMPVQDELWSNVA